MNLRKQLYPAKSMEQLGDYIKQGEGSIPGEYHERIDDDGIDHTDRLHGWYTFSEDGSEDGSVVFTVDENQRSGWLTVSEDVFSCGAIGIVVKSRHEIPATNFVQP